MSLARKCVVWVCSLGLILEVVAATTNVLPPWELNECPIPSDPQKHPVATYQRQLIDLGRMHYVATEFWLVYSGSMANQRCELEAGVIYHVQRFNKTSFSYTRSKDGKEEVVMCTGKQLWLGDESFGFVSCAMNEKQASFAAWKWWSEVPMSYITKVMIAVACLLVLIAFVALTVFLIRRRRNNARVNLPQLDMY